MSDKLPCEILECQMFFVNQQMITEFFSSHIENISCWHFAFCVCLVQYARSLKNFEAEQPYSLSSYFAGHLKSHRSWLKEQRAEALPELNVEMLQSFIPEFMKHLHVTMLLHGNLTQSGQSS